MRRILRPPRGTIFLIALLTGVGVTVLRAVPVRSMIGGGSLSRSGEALVRRVVDGDTVVLSSGEPVRYIGMDTPELHHPRKPVQAYGREAMEFNRRLVEGKQVHLEFDVERYDKYHRLLVYVFLQDGTFVNAELVRQGYARLMTIPPNVKYADLFVKLQREAREARRGLWGKK